MKYGDRTHCSAGHEFTPENTIWRSDSGGRRCRTCTNRRNREYSSIWNKANPERIAAYNQTWREKNPGAASAASLRWQKANLDRHADTERRRRARKRNAPSDSHTRQDVFVRDNGICQLCGIKLNPANWHEDHIIPLARGGSDLIENCQATCPPCNQRKHAKILEAAQ